MKIKQLRDLKYRLALVGAEYVAAGYPLREFAFTNGLQVLIRAWSQLPQDRRNRQNGGVPEWLPQEQRDEAQAQLERREKRREKKAKKKDDADEQ